ncbi:MAG: GNAT family N-acetyltransferase [Erythrobacter sp.]
MSHPIRQFRDEDASALVALTQSAIRVIGARAYSPDQVEAWAAKHDDPARFRARAANGATILVANDEADRPIGYALLEAAGDGRGHLDMLYGHPDHTRKGLAGALLAEAEREARARGMRAVFTEASELARPAFERAGYALLNRRDFSIEHAGKSVPIHNYAMEKRLA